MSNKAWDSKTEYSHPQAEGRSAKNAKIGKLNLNIKQKFMFLFDYGDELKFEVEVTDIKDVEKGAKYPRETKRNKPKVTTCEECKSSENPIEWYCEDHSMYLCDECAGMEKHVVYLSIQSLYF